MATDASERTDNESYKFGGTQPDNIFVKTATTNSEGELIGVQNPFPTDGDSVYEKDINTTISSSGTFTGDIKDLFNSYDLVDVLVDTSSTNPKTFTIKFNRPITTNQIGFGSADRNFSNVKILLQDISGTTRKAIDDSSNDTKFTSKLYSFTKSTFIQAVMEFHTVDEVSLNASFIPKNQSRSISAIEGIEDMDNSTEETLLANISFIGEAIDTLNYGIAIVTTYSDVASATDGLQIQFSKDRINWFWDDKFTIGAAAAKTFTVQTQTRWMRIVYINGITDQTIFQLSTQLKPVYVKPSSHRVNDVINGEDDAELVKANLTALSKLTNLYENITSYRGSLNTNNAWVNRKIVNESFHQHDSAITNPTIGITKGDTSITVDSVVGFIVGDTVKIEEDIVGIGIQEIGVLTITIIAGSVLTFDRPISNDYTTAATIERVITNMAVVGTLDNPVSFEIDPPIGTIWQFTRIIISITDGSAMDDGKFGGIPALNNGVSLRATTASGRTVTFGNWKTNGDMALDMFDIQYTDKAPAGENGLRGRWTFTKAEVVAELDGDASPIQKLEILIQDDLTDLTSFQIKGQGRVFSP